MKTAILVLALSLLSSAASADQLKCQVDHISMSGSAKVVTPLKRIPYQSADFTEIEANLVAVRYMGSGTSSGRHLIQLFVNGQVSDIRIENPGRGFLIQHEVPLGVRLQCWFE